METHKLSCIFTLTYEAKAVPLHAIEALVGKGSVVPTYS
jgi:hypothetical protein